MQNKDVFCEYMVRRRTTARIAAQKAVVVAVFLLLSLLGAFSLISSPSLYHIAFLLPWGISLIVTYYLITAMNVEYEYTVTNGEMDVDMIVAKRRRSRLITFHASNVEAFGPYLYQDHSGNRYQDTVMACEHPRAESLWYCVARVPGRGSVLVVFSANQKLLDAIRPFLRDGLWNVEYGG